MRATRIITFEGPEKAVLHQLDWSLAAGYHTRSDGLVIHVQVVNGPKDRGAKNIFSQRRKP